MKAISSLKAWRAKLEDPPRSRSIAAPSGVAERGEDEEQGGDKEDQRGQAKAAIGDDAERE